MNAAKYSEDFDVVDNCQVVGVHLKFHSTPWLENCLCSFWALELDSKENFIGCGLSLVG